MLLLLLLDELGFLERLFNCFPWFPGITILENLIHFLQCSATGLWVAEVDHGCDQEVYGCVDCIKERTELIVTYRSSHNNDEIK